ncbi:MAG: ABC transporter substrate-binding protein [Halodesulfurarchaeum sp.]
MSSHNDVSRRRFLQATGGAVGAATLAGCSGNGGDGTTTQTQTQTQTTTQETETTTAEPKTKEVYKPGSLAVEAVDDYTLELTLQKPFHAALSMLAYSSFSVVPEGIVGDIQGYEGEMEYSTFATDNPIGSGPFEFQGWTQGTEASVVKNPDYYRGTANMDEVHWQVIEKDPAQFNYAMNKNADLFTIPTSYYSQDKVSVEKKDSRGRQLGTYGPVRNGATLNYAGVPTINTFYVGFNMEAVPKPVRKAFAYAMNQELLVNEVFKGRGLPAYHLTPPGIYPHGADKYRQHAQERYPYGHNQTQLPKARQVMEDAGYGPNNQFTIEWTQYTSNAWLSMAKILRDKLANAHIDMQITQADFASLLKQGRNGNLEAYTLGWIADYPAPDNFLQLLDPPQTQTEQPGAVSYINWQPKYGSAAKDAEQAFNKIQNNRGPTDQAQQIRNDAYITMEEANWEDVGFLNVYHAIDEYFWYDTIDYEPFGGMGISRQKFDDTASTSSGDSTLSRTLTGTITTLDPIASTSTAGGEVITQMFDPLTNYKNGTTIVTNLGATDYSIADDQVTYTFDLAKDATFHNGEPVTADDYVYSFERLAASNNSRRASFILNTLGVKHDTKTITVNQ